MLYHDNVHSNEIVSEGTLKSMCVNRNILIIEAKRSFPWSQCILAMKYLSMVCLFLMRDDKVKMDMRTNVE